VKRGVDLPALGAALLIGAAIGWPLIAGETPLGWSDDPAMLAAWAVAMAMALWRLMRPRASGWAMALATTLAVVVGAGATLAALSGAGAFGNAGLGLWLFVLGLGFLAWRAMALTANAPTPDPLRARAAMLLTPAIFGLWLLYLWQVVVTGFGVPEVLLPAPSAIATVFAASLGTLYADFIQTFVKAVLIGYVLGCASGFAVAVLVDRVPFLKRGLLPFGNLVSALPIVGIAPIMVMWFGFDWPSKSAVVVVMTFFPMLVNTLAGLEATGRIERDLMRTYAAGYVETLIKVRLPNALPFVFNALKINSTLALIGAIVAEFFGTPIVGMGFRISTEVGRMNVDMVWATIFVAALAGSAFYGGVALIERALTFWHPSYRQ